MNSMLSKLLTNSNFVFCVRSKNLRNFVPHTNFFMKKNDTKPFLKNLIQLSKNFLDIKKNHLLHLRQLYCFHQR
uniref:Uncharacterized protein n=1 Tax=Panagrolaimus sp. JU765 TaxID=591449 RepID=A0AC34QVR7_9BILA